MHCAFFVFFFFNDTATTEIYTLSLHDALPILLGSVLWGMSDRLFGRYKVPILIGTGMSLTSLTCLAAFGTLSVPDRKSTRLNSSHLVISYAAFCLKKKISAVLLAKVPPVTLAY